MNVKRYTARTSRDALSLVRQALGDDAVVLSTKPCAEGVEVLAMAPDSLRQLEQASAASAAPVQPPRPAPAAAAPTAAPASLAAALRAPSGQPGQPAQRGAGEIEEDVARLSMSTLSFQDYVRERMLKRRQALLDAEGGRAPADGILQPDSAPFAARAAAKAPAVPDEFAFPPTAPVAPVVPTTPVAPVAPAALAAQAALPVLHDALDAPADVRAVAPQPSWPEPAAVRQPPAAPPAYAAPMAPAAPAGRDNLADMLHELRSVRGLIEDRFGALAFIDRLQRQPVQARLTQKLLDCGFSPALIRKLSDSLPPDATDDDAWAAGVLQRNLPTAEHEPALEDQGGVYALVGSTGVGKTTTTAKLAAAFAAKHGATHLGLITLDAYRVAAHEQLRAYGRILGVPVHTAHDRTSLEDLLDLLAAKKMVLIDTAGMAQRDTRTGELLDMLAHRSVQRLLVVNSAAQGETIEDVMLSYRVAACAGVVLSKTDEAVKLGPALDAVIRHKSKVIGVANGQRVPEDWHRLSAQALVQRALKPVIGSAWRMDATDVSLVLAGVGGADAPVSA